MAVGLERATQVAYASREQGLSTGYTVVVQHGEVQERSLTPGDIVFDLLLARHQRDEVFNLLCVGMPQLIEGIEIGKAPNIESDLPTRDRITAIAQRCVQGSEQVDHAAGRTEASTFEDVLTTSERHILLRTRTIDVECAHHGGDVDVIIVQHRKRTTLSDHV